MINDKRNLSLMRNKLSLLILIFLFTLSGYSQEETKLLKLTLEEVISKAKGESPNMAISKARFNNSRWNLESFEARLKPQINLDLTVPSLSNNIVFDPLDQSYVNVSNSNVGYEFGLTQTIAKTGGEIFATHAMNRTDRFGDAKSVDYLLTPVQIGFQQPLFRHNSLKWDLLIQPLLLKEAEHQLSEEMETVALEATNLFFSVYIARLNYENAIFRKSNADTLLVLSEGRYRVGKIAESELLRMQLNAKKVEGEIAGARLEQNTSTQNLRNFLGIKEVVNFELTPPSEIPDFIIDVDRTLAAAKANRSESLRYERQIIEADQKVAQSIEDHGVDANLFARFGLAKRNGSQITGAEKRTTHAEQIDFGVKIPILDWGRAKTARKIAESNKEILLLQIEQEKIKFEQDILLKISQIDLVREQAKLAKEGHEIAVKSYDITRKRYLIGKIGVTDLNIGQSELDSAFSNYMQSLRSFWTAYYELRKLTLYDFEKNAVIQN